MAASEVNLHDKPQQRDLDKCVHCGLCLNACPTYRELRVEMDSPRGRIYQMAQVSSGAAEISPSYIEHIDLCLACRGCETACPSGVQYGRLVEAARAEIETKIRRPWRTRLLRHMVFRKLLPSRFNLGLVGAVLYLYQASGLKKLVRMLGLLPRRLQEMESLAPEIETPFFFRYYGSVLTAEHAQRYRVAFLGGCIANISFARLNEATVRVLRKNGCEVSIPGAQTCCGALHVHAGLRDEARQLARRNIDALLDGNYDAIITNAGGCGSTLKEYGELLEHDPEYSEKARRFSALVKDVSEFLASIDLNPNLRGAPTIATYQDSCHLAHGQKIRSAPRKLLAMVPGLELREMQLSDLCCGSAGIYNVVHTDMAMALLEKKMTSVNGTGAEVIVTANPGCMLQLAAGVKKFGRGQRVAHVVEILDDAYGKP
ncbi:MAG TPA: heterodisulfide reductase-related iron-sulfur binding cluster [Bryobacteraceae bacterium]|jgi:glycolate oxidase iron-sulfur subunit|nr:heterodisulfide reductase-related iron-sulfur binding cluster [Bryobacteraceae bacterium]